ncbi:MAG: hypothetical protein CME69_09195 [Halobacteriovorax sp.]|nr:hypothetical protein [Halobacteriovorax sp.]
MFKKVLMTAAFASMAFGQSLEERVEALEYAGYENWFKFGGNLEYRFDNVETERKKGYTGISFNGDRNVRTAGDKETTAHHRLFTELDIEAKPSNKLSFYGRLAITKYFNTLNKGGGNYAADSGFNELFEGAGAGNSAIFMERAFVNYNFTNNLVLSVGRLPTIDGSPKHISEGRPMMGNYPYLAFAGIFDGLALTYNKELMGTMFKLRGIFTPFNQRNISVPYDKLSDASGNKLDENSETYSLMLEAERENMSWANRFHFTYQYIVVNNLNAFAPGSQLADLDQNGSPELYTVSTNAMLNSTRHVMNLELYGLFNTGLNFSFSYLMGNSKGTGMYTNRPLAAAGGDLTGSNIGTWFGASETDLDGDAWILNLSYDIKALRNARFGFEYMDAENNAFLYDAAARNRVGMYLPRGGDSKHVYWVQPVDANFRVRVGWQQANTKVTNLLGGYIGREIEIDDVATAYYTSLQFFF